MRRIDIEWSRMITGWTNEDVNEFVPDREGIYIIYYWNRSKWEKFTMGQGKLQDRLSDFILEKKRNVYVQTLLSGCGCGFVFGEVERKGDREGMSKYLYDSYKWKWIQFPPELNIDPIEVNLPDFD